jgi:PD-(D/E)XK nuclease superfamily
MFVHNDSLTFVRMKQKNLPIGRVYVVDEGPHAGKFYPSITRVLGAAPKPHLEAWKKRVGPVEAERQKVRGQVKGTALHTVAECYLSNKPLPKLMPNVAELWSYLRPVLDEHVGTIYAMEQDVFSDMLQVAGRFDLLAEWDGVLSVIDLKNARKARKKHWDSTQSYFAQGSFYACAIYEETGLKVKQVVLPIVSPDGAEPFVSHVSEHFSQLRKHIDNFYVAYEKELDKQGLDV